MKIAFADPLRLAAYHIFGVDHCYFTDRKLKEEINPDWGMSPRRMLQLLGNDAMKPVFGSDVWRKRWQMTYNIARDTDEVAVQHGDLHLTNDGTLADLRDKLDDIYWEVTHGTAR